jgi:hypothetical protein
MAIIKFSVMFKPFKDEKSLLLPYDIFIINTELTDVLNILVFLAFKLPRDLVVLLIDTDVSYEPSASIWSVRTIPVVKMKVKDSSETLLPIS